ncbi:MAG: cyclophilin-like fold protein [Candidatus Omnitrophica bacterium]|nr:cyclophilin-like fold protein [Candidatus Omnitrophota bacterium]
MLIVCKTRNYGFYIRFNHSATSQEIIQHLPIHSFVQKWADEIYFDIKIDAPSESATMDVSIGDVAYWPQGRCLCIFYGRTEASKTDKPVPASPVVIVGRTLASVEELRSIRPGEPISVFVLTKQRSFSCAKEPFLDSRKLTQAEIDVLVKKLLAEKQKSSFKK